MKTRAPFSYAAYANSRFSAPCLALNSTHSVILPQFEIRMYLQIFIFAEIFLNGTAEIHWQNSAQYVSRWGCSEWIK